MSETVFLRPVLNGDENRNEAFELNAEVGLLVGGVPHRLNADHHAAALRRDGALPAG